MKRLLFILLVAIFCTACKGKEQEPPIIDKLQSNEVQKKQKDALDKAFDAIGIDSEKKPAKETNVMEVNDTEQSKNTPHSNLNPTKSEDSSKKETVEQKLGKVGNKLESIVDKQMELLGEEW